LFASTKLKEMDSGSFPLVFYPVITTMPGSNSIDCGT